MPQEPELEQIIFKARDDIQERVSSEVSRVESGNLDIEELADEINEKVGERMERLLDRIYKEYKDASGYEEE